MQLRAVETMLLLLIANQVWISILLFQGDSFHIHNTPKDGNMFSIETIVARALYDSVYIMYIVVFLLQVFEWKAMIHVIEYQKDKEWSEIVEEVKS
jgi:hypothetical protein